MRANDSQAEIERNLAEMVREATEAAIESRQLMEAQRMGISNANISINAGGIGIAIAIAACAVVVTASSIGFAWQMSTRAEDRQEIRALREEIANLNAYRSRDEIRLNKLESKQ